MTRFVELDGDGNVISEREIAQDEIRACPHFILVPEHYRPDNSCRCNDRTHVAMRVWGYTWNVDRKEWV